MAKVYLICGKICSGKSYYASLLLKQIKAVILSTDEVTFDLTGNEQGKNYNIFAKKVNYYLLKKSVEIVEAGCNVILDWGFWTKKERQEVSSFLKKKNISFEWHYVDIDDEKWKLNIEKRNYQILQGKGGYNFYVDEGLQKKVNSKFELPSKNEVDVWWKNNL